MPTIHLLIKGKVHGVFYRATAREEARKLGVTGWVKNMPDGTVEALATGSQQQLDAFVAWCRQGPTRARVADVVITPQSDTVFEGFKIVH